MDGLDLPTALVEETFRADEVVVVQGEDGQTHVLFYLAPGQSGRYLLLKHAILGPEHGHVFGRSDVEDRP